MASPHQLPDELERASADLDTIIADVRAGIRSAHHYDQLEERAQAVTKRIAEAFRGSPARPTTVDIVAGRNGGVWLR